VDFPDEQENALRFSASFIGLPKRETHYYLLDAAPFWWAAAIVRNGCHVADRCHLQARGL
jgi:hypothetical protein